MNRDIVDGRMEREFRRRRLAVRMINHQARTQTIEEFTGLTRHQLATLRRQAGVSPDERFRGPARSTFDSFFSSARARSESAVLAFLYCALGASDILKPYETSDAAIECGERLCRTYETWQRLFPSTHYQFERLTLLREGLSRGDKIAFAHCGGCHAILLIDLFSNQRRLCEHCTRARRSDPNESGGLGKQREDDEKIDLTLYGLQLIGGQLLHERNGNYTLEDDVPWIG